MNVQVDITKQDVVEFNLYHHSRSPSSKRTKWALTLPGFLWSGFWLVLSLLSETPEETVLALMPLWLGGFAYIAVILLSWRRGVARQVGKYLAEGENKGLFGPRQVLLTPEGITETGELQTSTINWRAGEKIVVLPDCAYVYLNAVAAYIIPKRAFASEPGFDAFIGAAQDYHAQAVTDAASNLSNPLRAPAR